MNIKTLISKLEGIDGKVGVYLSDDEGYCLNSNFEVLVLKEDYIFRATTVWEEELDEIGDEGKEPTIKVKDLLIILKKLSQDKNIFIGTDDGKEKNSDFNFNFFEKKAVLLAEI